MNIALFASAFHPHVGGVEEVVRQLAHALGRQGHRALVITNRWPRDLPREEVFEGVPVFRLPLRTPSAGFKSRLTYLLTHRAVTRDVTRLLREHQVDVAHVHCVSANALYAQRASRGLGGLPLVVTSHSERTMDANRVFDQSPFMNAVLRESLAEADFVTACSQDTLDDLTRFMRGAMCPRNRVILNGVDLAEFSGARRDFSHPRPYVLALGRFVRPKGFDILLQAFARSKIAVSHDLILTGDGPEGDRLKALVKELSLSDHVHLPGRADRGQALALMQNASFFVLSSRHEGFPMVCLEAMGAGRAVVATAVGGVPESVQDGVTGLLVPKEDPAALATALARMAGDPGLRDRCGAAGRRRVEGLSWDRLVAEYLEVYRAVLGKRGGATTPFPEGNQRRMPDHHHA